MLKFLFCDVLSSLSMADVPVAVPPDVLQAASPAAIPLPESPAGDENPARPAEEVGCFFPFFSGVLLPPYVVFVMQIQGWPRLFWLTYVASSVGLAAFVFFLVCFRGE